MFPCLAVKHDGMLLFANLENQQGYYTSEELEHAYR